ncbi:MAG: type II toxin-antitoxin system PemK/MazF family toxin [Acidobacteria bacterium]|nr:type II toxin-antitoxin system PemK/MazF family toxin [Acidobacteriota bacterium]
MTLIHRGEIWLANLSPTIGREQAGLRPVLITSSNYFNQGFAQLVFAIPITSRDKHIRSHIAVRPPEGGLAATSFIMCEAMRSISKERLTKPLGTISSETIGKVEDTLRILLDL